MTAPQPIPFRLHVAQDTLNWIQSRVATARIIPDLQHPAGEEWAHGIPTTVVSELVEHWKTKYDWRKTEERINNTFKMFTILLDMPEVDETINLHFVHHRSSRENAVPLLFAHGWPGSFLEVENLLRPLTEPTDKNRQAFHVIAPSIPGFSFSTPPTKPGFSIKYVAALFHQLMTALGYPSYLVQGGDWGSMIGRALALDYPESCVGLHINFIVATPPPITKHPLTVLWLALRWFTPEEKKRLGKMVEWMEKESGYSRIQGTKPQTISYALQDSPVGMLAWLREKVSTLAEPDFIWDPETVITWTMMYVLPGTAANARIYREAIPVLKEEILNRVISKDVSLGVSSFPYDVGYVPEWWASKTIATDIVFWKEHEKGGHFASHEMGDDLISDFRLFAHIVKSKGRWDDLVKAGEQGGVGQLV